MTNFPMGPLHFAIWAIGRIMWLAALTVFSLALPLLAVGWIISYFHRRGNRRPPRSGSEN